MTSEFNLNVAQRLALGFAALLTILTVFVVGVAHWHQESVDAQQAFNQTVAPRLDTVRALERELLYVGISVRRYLLTLDPAARGQAELRLTRVRRTFTTLEERATGLEHREILARLSAGLEGYVGEALGMMDTAAQGRKPQREIALDYTRERALDTLREFLAGQDEQARAAFAVMANARDQSARALNWGSIVMLVGFLVIAASIAQSVARPTRELVRIAGAMQDGNWAPALAWAPRPGSPPGPTPRSEWRRIAAALGAAAIELQRRERALHATAAVASAVSSSLERDEVAHATLRAVVDYVGADVGVVYWRDADRLEPIGSFALDGQVATLAVGDGLPGQAARDGRRAVLENIPADAGFKVRLGHDEAPLRHVVAAPALFGGRAHGVLLVGGLRAFSPDALTFLDAAGNQLGIALQNLRAHAEIQGLLADTRAQAERIQSQNEELEAQHEELQAQHTELQLQAEQIQAQREELEAQYEQLSHNDATLRAKTKLLTEADARKDEFLGWLAHELRNPMAPITTSLHVLRQVDAGSDAARRALAVMERQTRHLVRLIDDLLDITRISHGKIEIRHERVDLADVIRTSVEDQHGAITARGLQVEVDVPGEPVWVDGDRTRLAQVIGNLLNNAVKFTDAGGSISVGLRAEAGHVSLSVRDTGMGIDPSFLPRLFTPFTQGPVTIARTRGGLGLGLALVKALVDLHGGSVLARSAGTGTGAEIVVRLPRIGAGLPADGLAARPVARRVLIIEDNIDAAQSLQAALELAGQEVDVAFTAADGLERARRRVPDAIICDIGLPDMAGYELARRVRAEGPLQDTLLVALTGYASARDRERTAASGFHCHLSKPATVDEVLALLGQQAGVRTRGASDGDSGAPPRGETSTGPRLLAEDEPTA